MSWFKYWMTWILREVGLSVREGYRGRRDKSLENQDWPWPCQLPNVWGRLATMDEHMKVHRQMGGVPCGGFDPTTIQYIRCHVTHVSFEHSAESFFHICTSLLTSFLKVFFFFFTKYSTFKNKNSKSRWGSKIIFNLMYFSSRKNLYHTTALSDYDFFF